MIPRYDLKMESANGDRACFRGILILICAANLDSSARMDIESISNWFLLFFEVRESRSRQ